jgi:uridine monophosphate synthetase
MSKLSYQQRAEQCKSTAGKKLLQLMASKQTNLALSADVTRAADLLALADLLGPDMCLLKTHIDIIEDFTPQLTAKLAELATRHQFMIFEDRKFADIGNTVKHQYAGGVYKIVEWADFTNAHVLPGPGIIEGLAAAAVNYPRGLILLAEMSSAGHLMDKAYMQATLKMAEQYPEFVMGFITQHALSTDASWINLTPGIKLETGTDALGQQYNTPESAIIDNGSDVIIVGRGIIGAEDIRAEAAKYRQRGWDAYSRRIS